MKRILLFMLALLTALCVSAFAEESALPEAGASMEGFTVTELSRLDSLGADVVTLTHDKTGARVIFVLNDDNNLGFSICFHTEPSDDTGMLHILEHASCAASEKYPGRDVFFDAIAQAYLTGLNAWTSNSSTNYYATSMDENQLETLADFYLDCSFHSALRTEPNYFYREGWRYEMASLEDELTINGIVYNEMQGTYGNIVTVALKNLNSALFPDTYQSRDAGGNPAVIPELSYEELMAFYDECYHPGNSVTMFYGNVDMTRFLKLLNDGYFSEAEARESSPISAGQSAFDAPVHMNYEFPASADAEADSAVICFSTVLTDADSADYRNYAICDAVTALMGEDSGALMEALNASGIGSSYYVYVDRVGTQYTLNFVATDADASRDEEFQALVLEKVAQMIEEGFDQDLLDSLFASAELSARLERNSSNVPETLFENLTWIQETGSDAVLRKAEAYAEAAELCVPGYAEGLMSKWVIENTHAALATTVPVPGLLEKNAQTLAESLAEVKAGMSEEEKQAVVDSTAAFAEWVEKETPKETLAKLDVVSPQTVSAEYPDIPFTSETKDGVSVYKADTQMDMISVDLYVDLSNLSVQDMRRLNALMTLCGCSTQTHSQQEISGQCARLLNSMSVSIGLEMLEDGGCIPRLMLAFYAPEESAAQAVNLAFEMLVSTDLTANADLLLQNIQSSVNSYKTPETLYKLLGAAVASPFDEVFALRNQLSGIANRDELSAMAQEFEQDKDALIASLTELRERALTKTNARVILAGDKRGEAEKALLACVATLPEASESAAPEAAGEALRTAYVGSTQASYLVRGIMLDALGETLSGDKLILCKLLSSEYLLPNLRLQMGAYSAGMSIDVNGRWLIQYYRGDTPFDADAVIMGMADYLESLEITQEQLDSYKLPVISDYLLSSGELNDAANQITGSISGFTRERRLQLVEEVRNATVEDVKALVPLLREMLEKSAVAVITTSEIAEANADSLDSVIPFA